MAIDWADVKRAVDPDRALGPSSDFDLNPELNRPNISLRPSAVLVGVQQRADGLHVLLTRRAAKLRNHGGQVAFPGGRQDPEDATPEDCALREAHEEVGLARDAPEVLGRLDAHITVTGFQVVPVVARIPTFNPLMDQGEVAEIFTVPLAHLADLTAYRQEGRYWQGRRRAYWAVPYGAWYIWGATARMLRGLALRLQGSEGWM